MDKVTSEMEIAGARLIGGGSTFNAEERREMARAIYLAMHSKAVDWQPIETAPEDGSWYLGYQETDGDYGGTMDVCRCWMKFHSSPGSGIIPTHWRPLPTAPGDAK